MDLVELYSYTYCIPYLLFLGFVFIFIIYEFHLINNKKSILSVRFGIISVSIIFIGLRGFVYTDWVNYYPFFKSLSSIIDFREIVHENQFMESGFTFYTLLIKSFTSNYFVYILINTIIDIVILDFFFKKYSPYYALAFFLFFIFNGIWIEFNLLKNSKSLMLFLLSIKYLEKRQIYPYLFLNILGLTFHSSSLVYILLYFVLNTKFLIRHMILIFVLGNIVFLSQTCIIKPIIIFISNILGGRYALYSQIYFNSDVYGGSFGISIGYIERTLTYIILYFTVPQLIKKYNNANIFINLYICYSIVYLFMSDVYILIQRLSLLFIISYAILFPCIFRLISLKTKRIFIMSIFLYAIMRIGISNNNIFAKYDNILWGIESYNKRQEYFLYDIKMK